MAHFSIGERVSTTAPLDSGGWSFGPDVPAGMTGTVRDTEGQPLAGTNYLVKWDNGSEAWAPEDDLLPA
jgi:protocatechuate 3,4-dioxygenase beta subunit